MNSVILIGNLTKDPEYRESGSGVCRFSIAVTDGYGDNETVSYPTIVAFGKTAQNCGKFLQKGSKVCVQGRIQTGSYERDGRKIYTTDIIGNRVEFLSRAENKEHEGFSKLSDNEVPF